MKESILYYDNLPLKQWCKKNKVKYSTVINVKNAEKLTLEEAVDRAILITKRQEEESKKSPCYNCNVRNCFGCKYLIFENERI